MQTNALHDLLAEYGEVMAKRYASLLRSVSGIPMRLSDTITCCADRQPA
ncbi:hypothetical protein LU604_08640 [Erwinia tracheiphila]|nr:hypothetical protein [Erwinia tracheiphila]UIA84934.1 hypothetical protein LU604_08640 [Erwinia tracheiphila]UIA93531.1 hypothetical protein LU632_08605 [Erwinia tracheiphila]